MNLRARKKKLAEQKAKKIATSVVHPNKESNQSKKTNREIPQASDFSVVPEDVINVLIDRFFTGQGENQMLEQEESDSEECSSRRKRKITEAKQIVNGEEHMSEMSKKGKRTKVSYKARKNDGAVHSTSKFRQTAGGRSFSIEEEPESVTVTFGERVRTDHEDTIPKRKTSNVEQEQSNLVVFSGKSEPKRPRGRPKKVKDTTASNKVSEVDGVDELPPQPRERADGPVAISTEEKPEIEIRNIGVLTPEHNNQVCVEALNATPLTCSYTGKKLRTLASFTEGRSAVRKVVEYNTKGQPVGPVAKKFTSFLGIVGRRLVPINYESWSKVPIELKNKLWNHVEDKYVVDSKRKKRTLSSIGEKWKSFKSNLWKIYILPFKDQPELLNSPPEQYGFIKRDHWQAFVRFRFSEEFQTLSKLQAERRAKNLYNHRLGRKGYAGLVEELKQSLGTSVEDIDRCALWKKARQDKDGTYMSDVVKQKADLIDELVKLKDDGNLVIQGRSDVLTLALGTPENSYRVRGVGGSITPCSYFKLRKRSSKKYISELEQKANEQAHKLLEMNKTVKELQEQSHTISPQCPSLATPPSAACNTSNSDNIKNSVTPSLGSRSQDESGCANDDRPFYFDFETDFQSTEKGNSKSDVLPPEFGFRAGKSKECRLAVGSIANIVARGIVFEGVKPDEKIHNTLLEESNVRVSVQYAVSPNALLPIPVIGEMSLVKDAIGSFVAWPKEFVLTGVQEEKNEVAKDKSGPIQASAPVEVKSGPIQPSAPAEKKSSPIQPSAPAEEKSASFAPAEDTSGPIQAFASFIDQSMPTNEIIVPIQNVIFNEEVEVHLQKTHLMQFCNMQEITASCIISYIGFLYQNLNSYQENYGFVNPASISCAWGPEASSLITKRLQNGNMNQLVFIPYIAKGHWILIVIDSSTLDVYWLDPLQKPPSMDIKIYITTGLKALQTGGERRPNPTWHCVKCPNQAVEVHCGYTVLRYMRELMEEPSRPLAERVMQMSKKSSYLQDEIDEVRLELMDYILTHM